MFPASSHYSTGTKEKVLRQSCFLIILPPLTTVPASKKSVETILLLLYYILLMFLSSAHYSTGIEEEVLRQFCFFIITYLYSEA